MVITEERFRYPSENDEGGAGASDVSSIIHESRLQKIPYARLGKVQELLFRHEAEPEDGHHESHVQRLLRASSKSEGDRGYL